MASQSHSTIISDLGPWDPDTIALLLGLSPDEVSVEVLGKDPMATNNTSRAKLTFTSEEQMRRIINCYNGLTIPMTHGYHYYRFDTRMDDGEARVSPPLHLQLMAVSTQELERRVKSLCGDNVNIKNMVKFSNNKRDKVHYHAALAYELVTILRSRPVKYYRGVPVPKDATLELLNYLRICHLWPSQESQRKGVSASNYLTVRKQHGEEHNQVWDLCRDLIHSVIPDAIYNALAITRGFRGSPHVDLHDKTFQHVIAFGDFEGGQLCCELDELGTETVAIDVNSRFGRIDGRSVHWVNGWSGERYSVVYYSTDENDSKERLPQMEHVAWMSKHPCQDTKTEKVPPKQYGVHQNSNETYANTRLPTALPIVGLGCSSFSTFFSSDDVALTVDTISKDHSVVQGWIETIRHAVLDRGIYLLDTAPWYGHGTSEKVVGFALDTILSDESVSSNHTANESSHTPLTRQRTGFLHRSRLIVNTKVGRYESDPLKMFDFSYSTTIQSVYRSLERMNCNYIDVLQLHDPEFAPSMNVLMEETIPALLECKKRGWTKAIGLTGYPLKVQHEIILKCSKHFKDGLVFDQSLVYCHNNLHDMSLFNDNCFTLSNGTQLLPSTNNVSFAKFCQLHGISLMCAAPLSMGLLTNSGPPSWHPAPSSLKEACAEAAALCRSKGVDISSLAILYSLSQSEVGCTLIGMKDVREVDAASDLAIRFCCIDFNRKHTACRETELNSILGEAVSATEKDVLLQLIDNERGPIAKVWDNGDYRWNGEDEAIKFWSHVSQLKAAQQTK